MLTLLNVPFALVGGVFGLALAGMPVSVAAAVGFIALIGQAALNGVLVHVGHRRAARGGRSACEEAIIERLRASGCARC